MASHLSLVRSAEELVHQETYLEVGQPAVLSHRSGNTVPQPVTKKNCTLFLPGRFLLHFRDCLVKSLNTHGWHFCNSGVFATSDAPALPLTRAFLPLLNYRFSHLWTRSELHGHSLPNKKAGHAAVIIAAGQLIRTSGRTQKLTASRKEKCWLVSSRVTCPFLLLSSRLSRSCALGVLASHSNSSASFCCCGKQQFQSQPSPEVLWEIPVGERVHFSQK